MDAKDTVLKTSVIYDIAYTRTKKEKAYALVLIAEKQAEVSFKAGMQEVIDFINSDCNHSKKEDRHAVIKPCLECFQNKLKEWSKETKVG